MTELLTSRMVSVSIHCAPSKVYAFVSNPANLPKWATTFCRSIAHSNGAWVIETAQGPMNIRFAPKNPFGVLDHYLTSSSGEEIFVPMRVVPNVEGCEMIFTLFQQPGMSDDNYAHDAELVKQDLGTLKRFLEGSLGSAT